MLSRREDLRLTTPSFNSFAPMAVPQVYLPLKGHLKDTFSIPVLLYTNEAGSVALAPQNIPILREGGYRSWTYWNLFSSHLLSALSLKCH